MTVTGRTGGAKTPLLSQPVQQRLSAHALERGVDDMGRRAVLWRIDLCVGDRPDLLAQTIRERSHPCGVLVEIGGQQSCRRTEAGDAGHVLRAGAQAALLLSAAPLRRQRPAPP